MEWKQIQREMIRSFTSNLNQLEIHFILHGPFNNSAWESVMQMKIRKTRLNWMSIFIWMVFFRSLNQEFNILNELDTLFSR